MLVENCAPVSVCDQINEELLADLSGRSDYLTIRYKFVVKCSTLKLSPKQKVGTGRTNDNVVSYETAACGIEHFG